MGKQHNQEHTAGHARWGNSPRGHPDQGHVPQLQPPISHGLAKGFQQLRQQLSPAGDMTKALCQQQPPTGLGEGGQVSVPDFPIAVSGLGLCQQ